MALPPKRLNVLPNPWCALDKDARPCGVCAVDPDLFGLRYVGARVNSDLSGPQSKAPKDPVTGRQHSDKSWFEAYQISKRMRTVFTFATEPVSVSNEAEAGAVIRKKLRTCELLPADEAAAKAAKIPWREPAVALAEEKAKAREKFDAQLGEGAFDEMNAGREPVPGTEPEEKPEPEPDSEEEYGSDSEPVATDKAEQPKPASKKADKASKKTAAPRAAPKPGSD